MRIGVVGAGAMGCLFGGLLAEAGHEVMLVDVSERQIAAIQADGLRLATDAGERWVRLPAGRADAVQGACDLIIVFTKGMHTRAAVAGVRHLVGPATWALTVQNGLGNADAIAATVPAGRIIAGMTSWPADLVAPGHVASHGHGTVRIWRWDGVEDPEVARIAAMLDEAGLACRADPQVEIAIWEKVAFNAAMNSLAAVTRLDVGGLADRPGGRDLAHAIASETLAVAEARGLAVDRARVDSLIALALAEHRGHKPSMLQDVLAGRPTEIESINGAICAEGARLGVACPVTWTLLNLVRMVQPD